MIFSNFDLTKDSEFALFSKKVTEDFIAFKISKGREISIFDALLEYAELKEIDADLLGDCVKNDTTIRGLIQRELDSKEVSDYSDW